MGFKVVDRLPEDYITWESHGIRGGCGTGQGGRKVHVWRCGEFGFVLVGATLTLWAGEAGKEQPSLVIEREGGFCHIDEAIAFSQGWAGRTLPVEPVGEKK